MIPKIKEYISENIGKWPIAIGSQYTLRPLFRSNINYNFVENYSLITRVVLWFGNNDHFPVLVSKIMDDSLSMSSIRSSIAFEKTVNDSISYTLFPEVFDIARIDGRIVLFEEAVRRSTYDSELKHAIIGPERSLPHFQRVMESQFVEMGNLFHKLNGVQISGEPRKWGEWAYNLGQEFDTRTSLRSNPLTRLKLERMRKAIDSIPMCQTPVIADMVCPNIFGGPKLIDNIIPDIEGLNGRLPGVINVFRFLVTYFYSPPVSQVFEDWLYALAVAITDREGRTVIGPLVRKILSEAGVNPDQTEVVWAFFMAASLFEMNDKLEFYKDSSSMLTAKRSQYYQWAKQMVKIQGSIRSGCTFDPKPVILAHEYLQTQESLGVSLNPKQAILAVIPKFTRPAVQWLNRISASNSYLDRMKENLIKRLYR